MIVFLNKTNSSNLYPPRRATSEKHVNPIYLELCSPCISFRRLQKPIKYVLVLSLIKKVYLSTQFQYMVKVVCKVNVFGCMLVYISLTLI